MTDGLAGLRREDVEAMPAYLLSRETAPGTTDAPRTADTGVASSLSESGGVLADQPVNVITATLEGVPPQGDYGVMPSYADTLSDPDIAAVTNFIRTSWGNDAPANATRSMVATLRAEVDEPDPAVLKANACPTVPAAHLDPQTRARIAEMVRAQVQHVGRGLGIKALRHEAPRRRDAQTQGKNLVGMHAGPLRPSNLRQPAIGSGPVKDAPQLTRRRAVLRTVAFGHPGPGHRLMAW
jgi:hypothetical protein